VSPCACSDSPSSQKTLFDLSNPEDGGTMILQKLATMYQSTRRNILGAYASFSASLINWIRRTTQVMGTLVHTYTIFLLDIFHSVCVRIISSALCLRTP